MSPIPTKRCCRSIGNQANPYHELSLSFRRTERSVSEKDQGVANRRDLFQPPSCGFHLNSLPLKNQKTSADFLVVFSLLVTPLQFWTNSKQVPNLLKTTLPVPRPNSFLVSIQVQISEGTYIAGTTCSTSALLATKLSSDIHLETSNWNNRFWFVDVWGTRINFGTYSFLKTMEALYMNLHFPPPKKNIPYTKVDEAITQKKLRKQPFPQKLSQDPLKPWGGISLARTLRTT